MTSKTVMDALPTTTDIRLRGNHEAPNYLGSTGIAITPPLTPDCDNSQYNRSDAVVSPEDCEPARVATAQADPDRRTKRRLLGDSKQVHTVPVRQIEVVTTSLSEPYMAHVEEPVIVATSMYGQAGERDRAINAAMPDVKKLPSDMAGGKSSTRSGQTKSLSTMIGYFPASPHLPSHPDPPVALATTFPSLQRRGAVRGATGVRFASAKRNGATLGELSGSVTTSSTGGLTRTAHTSGCRPGSFIGITAQPSGSLSEQTDFTAWQTDRTPVPAGEQSHSVRSQPEAMKPAQPILQPAIALAKPIAGPPPGSRVARLKAHFEGAKVDTSTSARLSDKRTSADGTAKRRFATVVVPDMSFETSNASASEGAVKLKVALLGNVDQGLSESPTSCNSAHSTDSRRSVLQRLGGDTKPCPACRKLVVRLDKDRAIGPYAVAWHAGCLVCGADTDHAHAELAIKRRKAKGCKKRLDSAAGVDVHGTVWCRRCTLEARIQTARQADSGISPAPARRTGRGTSMVDMRRSSVSRDSFRRSTFPSGTKAEVSVVKVDDGVGVASVKDAKSTGKLQRRGAVDVRLGRRMSGACRGKLEMRV